MADQHTPAPGIETEVTIHTMPLPGESKVMMFVEANAHVTHVIALTTSAVRQLVVGLLDALDVASLEEEPAAGKEPSEL